MIHNFGPTDARRFRQEAQTATLTKPHHRGPGARSTTVSPINCDAEYWSIVNGIKQRHDNRLRMPTIKLFDGNWILRGRVAHTYTASFQEIDGETGTGKIEMPVDYYLSQWVIDHNGRTTKNIHVTVDKDGVRWSGRMDHYEIEKQQDGTMICRVLFKHDFEELKHILCWSNPFLPAEIQFPKWWILFACAPVEKPEMVKYTGAQANSLNSDLQSGASKPPFFAIFSASNRRCGCCRTIRSMPISGSTSISRHGRWLSRPIRSARTILSSLFCWRGSRISSPSRNRRCKTLS